jgi:hypothetical protein
MDNKMSYTKSLRHVTNERAVIFDLDDTLAQHGDGGDWHDLANAQPIMPILELAQMLHRHQHDIVVVTARPNTYRKETEKWLWTWLPQVAAIYMMEDEADVTAAEMKAAALEDIDAIWDVHLALDDSPHNSQMYADHGVLCLRPMTNESYWAAHGDH